ncbi:uncharacterized protein LOC62_06G008088 [Vanrija pseudolonga]|uniref:Uncharacterized protein n=1 Tax=Vanrija pseudolonga TaxID=143232 RepID=A0AAF1BQ12_9TREE|nr:hypothetical protein LOC62_06G008088 [Vanrija pseudolonga]
MRIAALLLLAVPFASAQSASANASVSASPSPSVSINSSASTNASSTSSQSSLGPSPTPASASSSTLPVPVHPGVSITTPNATTYWVKGKGYNPASWTPFATNNSAALPKFNLWLSHANVSMLGAAPSLIVNNYLLTKGGLDIAENNASTTFYAGQLDSVVPGPGFVAALISAGNLSDVWAVSAPFEIKPDGTKPFADTKPGAAGRRAALPASNGVTLLLGGVGVVVGAALLV